MIDTAHIDPIADVRQRQEPLHAGDVASVHGVMERFDVGIVDHGVDATTVLGSSKELAVGGLPALFVCVAGPSASGALDTLARYGETSP